MKNANVKIISDGTSEGTAVYAEGTKLKLVQRVQIEITAEGLAQAIITLFPESLDLSNFEAKVIELN